MQIKFKRCSTVEQVARLLISTEVKTYSRTPTHWASVLRNSHAERLRILLQELQSLQDTCKITIRRIYGENHKNWLKNRFAVTVWNSGILYTTTRTLDNKAMMMLNGKAN